MTIAVPAGGIPAKLRLHQAKNMIGAGLLSLPWTMEQASLGPGIAAMVIMAFLNGASLMLLALSCHLTNLFSYNAIGAYCFGPQIGRFMQAVVGLYAFGSCVTYAVLVGDFLPPVLLSAGAHSWFARRDFIIGVVSLCIFLPLSLLKDLNSMRFTSIVGLICSLYAMLLLLAQVSTHEPLSEMTATPGIGLWNALPTINVAYSLHYNGPRFYEELKDRSVKRYGIATLWAMASCATLYTVTAVLGYVAFGTKVEGDFLKNFPDGYVPAIVGRLLLGFTIITTYPLSFHSLRASVLVALQPCLSTAPPKLVHVTVTVVFVFLSAVVGIAIPNVTVVLGYKGAVLGSLIVYIFPSLMYWTVWADSSAKTTQYRALYETKDDTSSVVSLNADEGVTHDQDYDRLLSPESDDTRSLKSHRSALSVVASVHSRRVHGLTATATADTNTSVASFRMLRKSMWTPTGFLCLLMVLWGVAMGVMGALSTAGVFKN